ncbi:MAG: aldo/keto reductase [Neptuniibacter sp.]
MQYSYLGSTNLQVSNITLGTMTFGTTTDEKEAHRVLDSAVDMGINLIDTSNDYGKPNWGLSESIIGNWLSKNPSKRDRILLGTKVYQEKPVPRCPNEEAGLSAYKINKQIEESLKRLKTDHIDLYQVHHIDRNITGEEMWGVFGRLMDQGKILYTGSSNYNGWGLAKHQMQAKQHGQLGFISEQTMYNLICRYAELDVIPCAEDFNIGVLAYMPLAGGLLAGGDRKSSHSRANAVMQWYGLDEEDYGARLMKYENHCQEMGVSLNAMAISWVLANSAVTSAVVGIRDAEQLDGLKEAQELSLSEENIKFLDNLFPISAGKKLRHLPSPEAYAW